MSNCSHDRRLVTIARLGPSSPSLIISIDTGTRLMHYPSPGIFLPREINEEK